MAAPTLAMYIVLASGGLVMHFFYTPAGGGQSPRDHLGCPKIVLDHVHVYNIYIYINYVCVHHNAYVQELGIFLPLQQIIKHGVWLLMKPHLHIRHT